MKVIDKINSALNDERPFWSFEYFPPKTQEGVLNLYERIERMTKLNPTFIDITWRWGGKSKDLTQDICINSQTVYGIESNMHLTCTGSSIPEVHNVLQTAKKNNLQNILALRGDLPNPPKGSIVSPSATFADPIDSSDYEADLSSLKNLVSAEQLVKYIRANFSDYFCISVAGYPEGCTRNEDIDKDIIVLKKKIDAGADFVVSQLFYDTSKYMLWYNKCLENGITVPILPGIMPIQSYSGFERMVKLCNISVPDEIWSSLSSIKNNDLAVKDFGIDYTVNMIKKLMTFGIKGFHFYTLNLERSSRLILEKLFFVSVPPKSSLNDTQGFNNITSSTNKSLPWPSACQEKRAGENVRPIFWHNNADSYILRTESWDEFPNGRWGDYRSPAFGELDYGKYWSFTLEKILDLWGAPESENDIQNIFYNYCSGRLESLPWSVSSIQTESNEIADNLSILNKSGYLTINSQPNCNGADSSDPVHGWGPKNGFVYKKAYVEFFIHPARFIKLLKKIDEFNAKNGSLDINSNIITYLATSLNTDKLYSNFDTNKPNAVSWGVFPGCEIIQPTIVDSNSFLAWKDEAYDYWKMWASSYSSEYAKSADFLLNIKDTYFLMNIVDNNYTRSPDFIYNFLLEI
ncbi:hypothetical protein BB561_005282 [Smittium simulii]|uniref:MTHFR SAM-binding regulatory domain-containing protein n=1 Tax=Smittium simulii TaxID=133385 RepID=A0A2T9YB56_9FUNG|nr:hypothetical protein BB561_005282 [Smittium simulii]